MSRKTMLTIILVVICVLLIAAALIVGLTGSIRPGDQEQSQPDANVTESVDPTEGMEGPDGTEDTTPGNTQEETKIPSAQGGVTGNQNDQIDDLFPDENAVVNRPPIIEGEPDGSGNTGGSTGNGNTGTTGGNTGTTGGNTGTTSPETGVPGDIPGNTGPETVDPGENPGNPGGNTGNEGSTPTNPTVPPDNEFNLTLEELLTGKPVG